LSNFLLDNSLHFGVNKIISFQASRKFREDDSC